MKAIVIGGTGQVGRQLVRALRLRPEYTKVVSISRRKLPSDITESVKQATPNTSADKLHEVILNDMTKLNQIRPNILQHSTNGEVFDAAFSALGVRYPNALSEKEIFQSEVDINSKFIDIAKELGVKYFAYNSFVNASSNSPRPHIRSKGFVEQKIRDSKFTKASVFRPAWILRPKPSPDSFRNKHMYYFALFDHFVRSNFRFVGYFMYIPVALLSSKMKAVTPEQLAEAMVIDSLTPPDYTRRGWKGFKRFYYDDIMNILKQKTFL